MNNPFYPHRFVPSNFATPHVPQQRLIQTPNGSFSYNQRLSPLSPHSSIQTFNSGDINVYQNVQSRNPNIQRNLFPSTPQTTRIPTVDVEMEDAFSPTLRNYTPTSQLYAKKYFKVKKKTLKKRNSSRLRRRYTKFNAVPSILIPTQYQNKNGNVSKAKADFLMYFMIPGLFKYWKQPPAEKVYKIFVNDVIKGSGKVVVDKNTIKKANVDVGNYIRGLDTGGVVKSQMKRVSNVLSKNKRNRSLPGVQNLVVGSSSLRRDVDKEFGICLFNCCKDESVVVLSKMNNLFKCLGNGLFGNDDFIYLKIMIDEAKGDLIINCAPINDEIGFFNLKFAFQVLSSTLTQSKFQELFNENNITINNHTSRLIKLYKQKLIEPINYLFQVRSADLGNNIHKNVKRIIVFDLHGLRTIHLSTPNYRINVIKLKAYILGYILLNDYEYLLKYLKVDLNNSQIQDIKSDIQEAIEEEPLFSQIPESVEIIFIAYGINPSYFDELNSQLEKDVCDDSLIDHYTYLNSDLTIFSILFRKLCCFQLWKRTGMKFVIDINADELINLDILHCIPRCGKFGLRWSLPQRKEVYDQFLKYISDLNIPELRRKCDLIGLKFISNVKWRLDEKKLEREELSIDQGRYDQWRLIIRIAPEWVKHLLNQANEGLTNNDNPILSAYSPKLDPGIINNSNSNNISPFIIKLLFWDTLIKIDKILHLDYDELCEFFENQTEFWDNLVDVLYFCAYNMMPHIKNFAHYFFLLNHVKEIFKNDLKERKATFKGVSSQNTEGHHKITSKIKKVHSTKNKLQNDNKTTLSHSLDNIINQDKISVYLENNVEKAIAKYNKSTRTVVNYREKSTSRDIYALLIHIPPYVDWERKNTFRVNVEKILISFLEHNNISIETYDKFENGISNIVVNSLLPLIVRTCNIDLWIDTLDQRVKDRIIEMLKKWLCKLNERLKEGTDKLCESRKRKRTAEETKRVRYKLNDDTSIVDLS